jgi:hypothetical protein
MGTAEIRVQITVQLVTGAQEAQAVCASLLALLRIAGYGPPLLPIPQPLMDCLLHPPLLLCTQKFLMMRIVQKHILQSAMMLVMMTMMKVIMMMTMVMTTIKMKKHLMFCLRTQARIKVVSMLVSMMFFDFCVPICKLSSKRVVITCMCLCVKQTTPHYLSVDVKGRAE